MVSLHLDAASLARVACASSADLARLSEEVVRWCAGRRRQDLARGLAKGDLALAVTDDSERRDQEGPPSAARWTLERLHLAECPPRFPRLYFHFASDEMVDWAHDRVDAVVAILRRFPGLCVRVEGFGHPSAPPPLGRAVAQARAAATRKMLLQRLRHDSGPRLQEDDEWWWADEDPNVGVNEPYGYDESLGRENSEFYRPQLLGKHVQAIGLWSPDPEQRNANFEPEDRCEDWDPEAKYRRVDFTVIGLRDLPRRA